MKLKNNQARSSYFIKIYHLDWVRVSDLFHDKITFVNMNLDIEVTRRVIEKLKHKNA